MIRIVERKVTPEEPYPKFLFESLAALSQLLSNENVELLNLIAREKPNSLDELAEKSGRSIKDVTDTFEALSSKGFAYIETKGVNHDQLRCLQRSRSLWAAPFYFESLTHKGIELS